jgi:xanthosine utilization system XapX-like protein
MKHVMRYYLLAINAGVSLLLIIFYHLLSSTSPAPAVVKVDITKITQPWILEIAGMNLTEEENVQQFSSRIQVMDDILQELSSQYHWIIISSQNVLAGAVDVTPLVSDEIKLNLESK